MSITAEALCSYIRTYHETFGLLIDELMTPQSVREWRGRSWLPARVNCYASETFGVAFEYVSQNSAEFHAVQGNERVEDLFVAAPADLRDVGPRILIGAPRCSICDIRLAESFPFRLKCCDADVTLRNVRFESPSRHWFREVEYAEVYGDASEARWSLEAARTRAREDVVGAIWLDRKAKTAGVRAYEALEESVKRAVLVLGSYSEEEGEERLRRICEALRSQDYDPLLVKDLQDIPHLDLSKKVNAIGSLCRFIVVDDFKPSGHLLELQICQMNRWITVILRSGAPASWMTAGMSAFSNMIKELQCDGKSLEEAIHDAIAWAEHTIGESTRDLNALYPWRKDSDQGAVPIDDRHIDDRQRLVWPSDEA